MLVRPTAINRTPGVAWPEAVSVACGVACDCQWDPWCQRGLWLWKGPMVLRGLRLSAWPTVCGVWLLVGPVVSHDLRLSGGLCYGPLLSCGLWLLMGPVVSHGLRLSEAPWLLVASVVVSGVEVNGVAGPVGRPCPPLSGPPACPSSLLPRTRSRDLSTVLQKCPSQLLSPRDSGSVDACDKVPSQTPLATVSVPRAPCRCPPAGPATS